MFDGFRFPLKTMGFVGLTASLYAALEAETFVSPVSAHDQVMHAWQARYGRGLLKLWNVEVDACGFGVDGGALVPGADGRGIGRVFVMNHRAALDIFVSLAFFEARLVSRADLAGWPVIGTAARRVGTLFVDRASRQSGATVVNAMADACARGDAVMLYPEGTTYQGDEVRDFHPGAFHAAIRAKAEVVPVGLAYEDEGLAFGDESFGSHMKRVAAQGRIRAALTVGAPLPAEGQTVDALRARAHDTVQALVDESRARLR